VADLKVAQGAVAAHNTKTHDAGIADVLHRLAVRFHNRAVALVDEAEHADRVAGLNQLLARETEQLAHGGVGLDEDVRFRVKHVLAIHRAVKMEGQQAALNCGSLVVHGRRCGCQTAWRPLDATDVSYTRTEASFRTTASLYTAAGSLAASNSDSAVAGWALESTTTVSSAASASASSAA